LCSDISSQEHEKKKAQNCPQYTSAANVISKSHLLVTPNTASKNLLG